MVALVSKYKETGVARHIVQGKSKLNAPLAKLGFPLDCAYLFL